MSHFAVAVFTREKPTEELLDAMLAPYDENDTDPESPHTVAETDDDGEVYYYNADARWDWWDVGGRFSDRLTIRKESREKYHGLDTANSALVRDCDFSPDKKAYAEALAWWHDHVETGDTGFLKPEYYTEHYGDAETYATHCSNWSTYAFVTADGEWNEPGRMGWFAIDDATKESLVDYNKALAEYLEIANRENMYVTVIDCHI